MDHGERVWGTILNQKTPVDETEPTLQAQTIQLLKEIVERCKVRTTKTRAGNIPIFFVVDEAGCLLKPRITPAVSSFSSFRRALKKIIPRSANESGANFLAILLDTTASISNFSPAMVMDPSARGIDQELMYPFYQITTIPLRPNPEHKVPLLKADDALEPKAVLAMSRPLFWLYIDPKDKALDYETGILLGQQKLIFAKNTAEIGTIRELEHAAGPGDVDGSGVYKTPRLTCNLTPADKGAYGSVSTGLARQEPGVRLICKRARTGDSCMSTLEPPGGCCDDAPATKRKSVAGISPKHRGPRRTCVHVLAVRRLGCRLPQPDEFTQHANQLFIPNHSPHVSVCFFLAKRECLGWTGSGLN